MNKITKENNMENLAIFTLKATLLSVAAVLIIASGVGLALIMLGY